MYDFAIANLNWDDFCGIFFLLCVWSMNNNYFTSINLMSAYRMICDLFAQIHVIISSSNTYSSEG